MNGPGTKPRSFVPALAAALALSGAVLAESPQPMRYALLAAMDKAQSQPSEESVVVTHQKLAALLRERYGFKTAELYDREARRQTILDTLSGMADLAASGDDVLIVLTLPDMNVGGDWLFVTDDANPDQTWTLISRLEIARLFTGKSSVEGTNVLLVLPSCGSDDDLDQTGRAPEGGISAITYCKRSGRRATLAEAFVSVLEANEERALPPSLLTELLGQSAPELRFRYSGARKSVTLTPHRSPFEEAAARLEGLGAPDERITALREVAERLGGKPVNDRSQAGLERLEARTLDLLHDPSQPSEVRIAAISTLGYLRSTQASQTLDSILASGGNADERRAALQALAMIGGGPLAALLQRAFQDPEPGVRREAVSLAGLRGETSVVPELIGITDADPDEGVRVTALQTLAILDPGDRREAAITLMQRLVYDPSLEVRREALTTLGGLGGSLPGNALLSLARREDPAFRQALAYATPKLFRERDRSTVEKALVSAAGPKNPQEVRVASLWALGEIGGVAAERTLSDALRDEQETTRVAAAEGLGKIRSEETIPQLAHALLNDTPAVRVAAARALGAIGDPRALKPLFNAVKDEDVYVRSAAEASLERIESQPQPEALSSQLKDFSPAVRLAAVKRLAESNSPAVITPLLDKLADDDFYVRQVAIQGLGRHRNEACLRALTKTLDDPNFLKRQGAAAALAALGMREAEQPLALHAKDQHAAVRSEIIRSLDKLESADLELFLAAADDRDAGVRLAAAEALVGFEAPEAQLALEKLSKDEVPEVRLRAVEGLRKSAGAGKNEGH